MRIDAATPTSRRYTMFAARLVAILIASLSPFRSALAQTDWACEVLLCLSDVRGATTEAACVPPIERLVASLLKGKPFPVCPLVGMTSDSPQVTQHATDASTCLASLLISGQDGPSGCRAFTLLEISEFGNPALRIWISPEGTLTETVLQAPSP